MKFTADRLWLLLSGSLMVMSVATLGGCATSANGHRSYFTSFIHRGSKIPSDATKEEIVAHISQQTAPIQSWRAMNSSVSVSKYPGVSLGSTVVAEQPNHFRMSVAKPLTGQNMLELGCNSDSLWFWSQDMEPKAVIACKHEELAAVQHQLPIPFQPEWLMQAMCVTPLDLESADLLRDPSNPHTVKLVSHVTNNAGENVRRICTVDLKKGEIRRHEIYDSQHRLIATAELNDYRNFPNTTACLPHEIRLKWEEQDMTMTIRLGGVEVNPPHIASTLWDVPQIAGYPVHELRREHLIRPDTAVAARPQQAKPKAITNYERDASSGVWLQNQEIQLQDQTAQQTPSPGRASLAETYPPPAAQNSFLAARQQSAPAAAADNSPNNPYFEGPADQPGQISLTGQQVPEPPAGFSATRSAQTPEWASPTVPRKSRDHLINGIPATEFEPPTVRSVTN